MKKLLCIFLILLSLISASGFKYDNSRVFSIESYYPLSSNIGLGFVDLEIEMELYDDFRLVLEAIFKNPPTKDLVPVMLEDTQINNMSFDPRTMILNIDISKEFLEYNMGSTLEYERLRGMVNTLGKFYNVNRVSISVEGVPYESGHFMLRPGEFFNVNFEDTIKIKRS